jgi:hypothetical protein
MPPRFSAHPLMSTFARSGCGFFHARETACGCQGMGRCTGLGASLAATVDQSLMRGLGTDRTKGSSRGCRALSTSMGLRPHRMRVADSPDLAARSQAGAPVMCVGGGVATSGAEERACDYSFVRPGETIPSSRPVAGVATRAAAVKAGRQATAAGGAKLAPGRDEAAAGRGLSAAVLWHEQWPR